jgi:hypothetical protein
VDLRSRIEELESGTTTNRTGWYYIWENTIIYI